MIQSSTDKMPAPLGLHPMQRMPGCSSAGWNSSRLLMHVDGHHRHRARHPSGRYAAVVEYAIFFPGRP